MSYNSQHPYSNTSPFTSMEYKPKSPEFTPVILGDDLRKGTSSPAAHLMVTLASHKMPETPPMTPPLDKDQKDQSAATYSHGLLVQQQMQYVDSLAKLRANHFDETPDITVSESTVESERERILSGLDMPMPATPTLLSPQQSAPPLLPSHMQQNPSTTRSAFFRPSYPRGPGSHTVTFADEAGSNSSDMSPPATPKGHPLDGPGSRQGLARYVDLNKHMRQVEQSKEKLLGFLGGSGAGVAAGMKGSGSELKRGKIYRPVQHAHTAALNPLSTTTGQKFKTTISYFARIPRKYRPILAGSLVLMLLITMAMRWNSGSAEYHDSLEEKRYAKGLHKAFVIGEGGLEPHTLTPQVHKYVDPIAANDPLTGNLANDMLVSPPAAAPSAYKFEFADRHEEMAALVSFLTSTSSNALPAINPTLPLDPQLVIDFDYTKESSARADMEQLVEDVWALFPLIVFGEMREPGHREIIRILSQYVTSPPVLVVEIDQRVDAEYLVPLLGRLIQTDELPQVVVKGRAVGGAKAIAAIQEAGQIKKHFTDLGIDIKPKQMKKKPKYVKDAERREKERILGPAPIEI